MSKILKNQTVSGISISDTGVTVPGSGQYVIPPQDYDLWAASNDAVTKIADGTLVANDGSQDLNVSDGVRLIQGGYTNKVQLDNDLLDTDRVKVLVNYDSSTIDHGQITGLADDDHTQYLTEARHDLLPQDNPHGVTKAQVGLSNVPNVDATDRANHTGTQTSSTISDFLAAVKSNETTTSLSINANVLTYTDEDGIATNIDLSVYLDDSNLARIVSGTLDGGTGIATFTRDDASTFTVDFSALNDQGAINTAISNHEAAADPHPQYTTSAEAAAAAPVQSVNGETGAVADVAKTDESNTFTESQTIYKTSGISSLTIDSDDNMAQTIYRAGTNLWSSGVDDFSGSNEFRITNTNGMTSGIQFRISTSRIDAHNKRIENVNNPVSAQDVATKDYVDSQAAPTVYTTYAQGYNLDTTTNLNTGTNFSTEAPIVGVLFGSVGVSNDFLKVGNGIQCNFTGDVEISVTAHMTSIAQRANVRLRCKKSGSQIGPIAAGGYIRSSSGHNESSVHISTFRTNVVDGDIITLACDQEAVSGTATFAQSATSFIYVKRVG